MTRADAYARLVEHCDELTEIAGLHSHKQVASTKRAFRLLIRALRNEDRARVLKAWSANECRGHIACYDAIWEAFRRPQTRRGK